MKQKMSKKILSVILTFNLVLQTFTPFLISPVYADDATPSATPTEEITPTAEPTPTPTEEPSPTPEITPEVTPTVDPTPTSTEEITPTPTEEVTPMPTQDPTPMITPEETPTPTIEVTPTIEIIPTTTSEVTPEPASNTDSQAPPTDNQNSNVIPGSDQESINNSDSTSVPESVTVSSQLSQALLPQPTLTTDKADYFPTEIAYITGTNFLPNTTYTLHVMSSDMPYVSFKVEVTSDENGNLSYAYQLDGHYRPNYSVDALDSSGKIVASMTFTDEAKITAKSHDGQMSDGSYAGGNVTTYSEGEYINFRFNVETKDSPTIGQIQVRFTGDDGTCLFFDNYFSLGSIVNVSGTSPTITYSSGPTADSFGTSNGEWIVVLNSSSISNGEATVYYTLKLSDEAGQCNGSSQHSRLNPGGGDVAQQGAQNVPVPANQVIELPEITVTKMIDRDGNGSFESTALAGEFSFALDGITTINTNSSGQVTFVNVVPDGSHSIAESQIDFSQGTYSFSSGTGTNCTFADGTATAVIASGTTPTNASCTFNNALQNANLTVTKVVTNDSGGTKTVSDFPLFIDSVSATSGTANTVSLGSHLVSETSDPGYTSAISGDCDANGNVSLTAGQNKTCTITNDDIAPTLTFTKVVTNNYGGNLEAADFPLFINGNSVTSGTPNTLLANRVYTLTETQQSGYTGGYFTGDCNAAGSTSLLPGENKTCTITNYDVQPKLTVTKVVTNDNGGTKVVSDFPLFVGSSSVKSGAQNGFNAGTYTVSETDSTGYTGVISGDCDVSGSVTLSVGDVKSCTITNNDDAPSLTLNKIVVNDNGGTSPESAWTLTADGGTAGTLSGAGAAGSTDVVSGSTFQAGTYTLSESTGPSGYSASDWVCTGTGTQNGNTITLELGQSAVCTITNNDQQARLTVVKDVLNPDNGAVDDAHKFSFNTSTQTDSSFGEGDNAVFTLDAGDYTVSEGYDANYDFVSISEDYVPGIPGYQIHLNPGEQKTITVINKQKKATIAVYKDVLAPNGVTDVTDPNIFSVTLNGETKDFSEGYPAMFTVNPGGPYGAVESDETNYLWVSQDGAVTVYSNGFATINIVNKQKAGLISGYKYDASTGLGIVNWVINLTGTATLSTTTDSTGFFQFLGLNTGNYTVTEDTPSGWTPTGSTSYDVTINSGTEDTTGSFTNFKNISISGQKYNDQNGDGDKDTGETGLSGWTIQLLNTSDVVLASTTTDSSGNYSFTDRGPDTYRVREVIQTGWAQTSDNPSDIVAVSGTDVTGVDFGNQMRGSITIIKDAKPNNAQNFSFSGTLGAFTLDDDSNATLPNSITFSDLGSNTYTITEGTVTGWKLTDLGCTGDVDAITDPTGRTATLTLNEPGENITCTFTNTKYGSITGYKFNDLNGDGDQDADEPRLDGWTVSLLDSSRTPLSSAVTGTSSWTLGQYKFTSLLPGTYYVCETLQDGWVQTNPKTGTLYNGTHCRQRTVNSNTPASADFGNFQKATIVVHKNVLGTDGISDPTDNTSFTAYLDGTNPKTISENTTATYDNLIPGTYTVSEGTEPAGYSWVSTTNGGSVTVTSGGSHDIYITNKQEAATLIVTKHVVNDNNGNGVAGNFTMNVTGTNVSDASFPGEETGTTITLDAGSYSVDEDSFPGYGKSLGADCRGTIAFGETKTCTITNDDIAPKLTVTKIVTKDNGGNASPDDFQLTVGGTSVLSGSENAYLANTPYTINETQMDGYDFVSITGDTKCPAVLGGTVTLDEGDDLTCTITNDDVAPTITLSKVVEGGSATAEDFDLYIGGNHTTSGQTVSVDANKAYSLDEDGPSGYSFDSITGDTKCPSALLGTVTLDEGEDVSCTITNTRNTGTIVVNKIIDIDGDLETEGDQSAGGNWQFDIDGTGQDTTDAAAQYTNTLGTATFSNLKTGQYTIVETTQPGYDLFSATCGTRNGTFDDTDSMDGVTVSNGVTTTCTFYNTPNGTIHGYKWSDYDFDGEVDFNEPKLSGWTINLYDWNTELRGFNTTPIKSMVTDDGDTHYGWYWFEHLFPGRYKVCEEQQSGWSQTFPESCHTMSLPDGNSNGFEEEVNAVPGPVYKFGNVELGKLTVVKYRDDNQNGEKDENEVTLSDWEINLAKEESIADTQTTGQNGETTFEDLMPGWYDLSENQQEKWHQSNIFCPSIDEGVDEMYTSSRRLNINPGDDITCYIGNYSNPEIRISKSNNASSDKTPGGSVGYRILINILDADVNNLVVKDLLPKGFVYRTGSYQVVINDLDVSSDFPAPTYSSPGTWSLGNVHKGDKIELFYTADISSDQQPGSYPDSAWAVGTSLSEEKVWALAQTEGFIDTNFVGTSVSVTKDQTRAEIYDVEKKVEGQVLGASTSLPATGANELWLLASLISLYFGLKLLRTSK